MAKAGVEAGSSTFGQGLRDYLRGELPDYMVPAHLMVLDAWPLTSNGKLDRKALPAPGLAPSRGAWQAPQDALQADLVTLWEEVLKRAPVSIDDNFFELGGDSIIAIQLVSRARQSGIRFSPRTCSNTRPCKVWRGSRCVARRPSTAMRRWLGRRR